MLEKIWDFLFPETWEFQIINIHPHKDGEAEALVIWKSNKHKFLKKYYHTTNNIFWFREDGKKVKGLNLLNSLRDYYNEEINKRVFK